VPNPLNPLDWIQTTQAWFTKTERSSGFRPYLIFLIICLVVGLILLFGFQGSQLITIFALWVVGAPLAIFPIIFCVKTFTDPDFCRSERHVQKMRQIEWEQMGTKQRPLEADQLGAEEIERSIPTKQLGDDTPEGL
jgi:hypothetical protein